MKPLRRTVLSVLLFGLVIGLPGMRCRIRPCPAAEKPVVEETKSGRSRAGCFEVLLADETLVGEILSLDAEKLLVRPVADETQVSREIALDRLETVKNTSPHPFFAVDTWREGNVTPRNRTRGEDATGRRLPPSLQRKTDETKPEIEMKSGYPKSVIVVDLRDGSRLVLSSLEMKNQTLRCRFLRPLADRPAIKTPEIAETDFPIDWVDAIRFHVTSLEEVLSPSEAWKKWAASADRNGDLIVVGADDSLDAYAGVVMELTPETLGFSVDGEILPVPRRRVVGLLMHRSAKEENAATSAYTGPERTEKKSNASGRLTLWDGNHVVFRSATIRDGKRLDWISVSGISGTATLEELDRMEFGLADVLFLSDLVPVGLKQSLTFDWEKQRPATSEAIEGLQRFRASRIRLSEDRFLPENELLTGVVSGRAGDSRRTKIAPKPIPDWKEILLDGIPYRKGLSIPAGTILEFQLPEPYSTLRGVVGIDDRLRPAGRCRLMIRADEQPLCDRIVRGDEPASPLKFELPKFARKIRVSVEPLDGFARPVTLGIADLKLLK